MSVPETFLALMERRPLHGYELKRQYDQLLGLRKPLRSGQIYSTLNRLQRDDLIGVLSVGQDGGPERTTFSLTQKGRDDLATWFQEPESPRPYLQPDLYAKAVLAVLTGRDAHDVLDRQRIAHRAAMRELIGLKVAASPAQAMACDLALMHLDADLRWIDLVEARADSLTDLLDV